MKRTSVVLVFLAIMWGTSALLSGVDVVIGTGAAWASTPMFKSTYGYSRYAALYRESEIGMTGSITSLAFRVSVPINTNIPVKIYLKSVSASELTTGTWSDLIAGSILVYDGPGDFSLAGWKVFDIADYYYAGSNLVVLCEGNIGGGGCGETIYFYYNYHGTTTTTAMALYYYMDNTPPTTQIFEVTNKRADLTLSFLAGLAIPEVQIEDVFPGVVLSWEPVAGATTYRVESSAQPDTGFTTLGATSNTVYSDPTEEKKFYRVYAGTE